MLRLFLLCVLAMVLPVNSVLAKLPAPAKIEAMHSDHASHQQEIAAASVFTADSKPQLHIHFGLFGQASKHVHEPIAATAIDCVKACQSMPNLMLFDAQLTHAFSLSAILVDALQAALYSITLAQLEDPPKRA